MFGLFYILTLLKKVSGTRYENRTRLSRMSPWARFCSFDWFLIFQGYPLQWINLYKSCVLTDRRIEHYCLILQCKDIYYFWYIQILFVKLFIFFLLSLKDSNLNSQNQNLLYYHYTKGQIIYSRVDRTRTCDRCWF